MEIILIVGTALLVFISLIVLGFKVLDENEPLILLGIVGVLFSITILPIYLSQKTEPLPSAKATYELISLNPQTGLSGSIKGGILGVSGSIDSTSECRFLTKDDNGKIEIRTFNATQVIFYETEEEPEAVAIFSRESYPYKGDEVKFELVRWELYVPKDSINNYINVN